MYESIAVGKHTQLDEYIKQIIDEGVEHQHKYGAQGKDVDMPEKYGRIIVMAQIK